MSRDFLTQIVAYKKKLLSEKKDFFAALKDKAIQGELTRYHIFKKAIAKPGQLNLIAEIKKASPSKGIIRKNFDVMQLAGIYVGAGAAAISVLTEEKYFLGKPMYLRNVSENFCVPVLAKDFIIDEVQIYEAFYMGASAVLLITAILEDVQLRQLLKTADQLDLDCLVEVHNEEDLDRALSCGAEIVGINNRNLDTFEVDVTTSQKLLPQIPNEKIRVVESGIRTNKEIETFRRLGANAVLIGETFLKADDVMEKIKEVMHG